MRFFAVAALLLSSVALAAPAEEKPKDTCCCCDISKPAIACFKDVKPEDCICAAVMCPKDAPTVWPKSTPLPTAVTKREEKTPAAGPPCCCCDASKDAIVCTVRAEGEDNSCICADVMCPKDAPTLTVHSSPKKTGN
ncbi:hypothetical protein F53441_9182 [Fusarium austroafricanum]|uniref:Extracellular membrane protein CFEM domain-containing protein n=1 Tax=Fusarium austroafricanum TaxID=2364996 RepID=A0A8H4P3Q7_9HYPO|nr:hypothetical protein F53441_9182 [Fusarium austroafricanum]